MAKMTICTLPTKTRDCAPQSPAADENDENDGCPSDKTTVCQKHSYEFGQTDGNLLKPSLER